MNYRLGWDPTKEALHTAEIVALMKPCLPVDDAELPANCDPGSTLPINDQSHFNSCCGNATDKALERDHQIETGKVVNLSARFSYLAARTMDGTNDQGDGGASISGGALGTVKFGTVLEEQFPYWTDSFDPSFPDSIVALGSNHRVRSATPLPDVDSIIRFVGSGQGAVIFGIWWTDALRQYCGGGPVANYSTHGTLGGHALCCPGYVTVSGVKCPKIWNSHGRGWGANGTMVVMPDTFQKMLDVAPFKAMGVSGLPSFTKRTTYEGMYA